MTANPSAIVDPAAGSPPASVVDPPLLKMSELAERSGVSAGTIKHYLREGLLGRASDVVRTSPQHGLLPAGRSSSGSS